MRTKRLKGGILTSFLFLFTSTVLATGPQILHGHVPAVVAQMTPLGTLPETNNLNLAISLPLRNQAALSNLLSQIYDPTSPNYHHYLTPEQFTEKFGPTESDYQAVIAFANANALRVTAPWPNRLLLDVSGTAGQVERALHLTLNVYRHPTENRNFYAPSTEPSLDLSVPILHISGLDNFELPRPRLVATRLATSQNVSGNSGSGPGGTYMGKDFRAAYVPDSSRDGSGQMVGLLEFDGYSASDINAYESQAGLPNIPLQSVLIDGASSGPQNPEADVEVALDIEVAISMATNLSKVVVYIAPNGQPFEDILNSMVLSNQVKQFSCSWYVSDGPAEPAADQIWEQMAAQGQSFFNASGDSCAYTGLISFPGDSPYITQVGGTTLSTTGPGGAWSSETVWNWGNGEGSSGGVSTQYPIPSWQTNISMTANQGSSKMRNTPDVAMTADNVYVRVDGGNYSVGGTSCAAPLWAGFAALVNQQAAASGQSSIGFINPALYAIGTEPNYTSDFHDIATGNNTWAGSPSKFYAVRGYDLCTGWGTPAGQKLIDALAIREPLIISPANGFVSTGGVGGPFTVTSGELSVTNAGTNVLAWTVANTSLWLNVSLSGGALMPSSPAEVVTVSLNNTASNLAVGTYSATLWFTNVVDGYGQGVSYTLDVIAAPTITSQPTNQAVPEGATAMFTVSAMGGLPLSYQWQLNGKNLTDGGNILGSQTTNLTVSDVSDVYVGNYSITVTNLAGVAVSSNAILSIIPSPPIITIQPTNQTAVVGQTVIFSASAVGNMPMSYQWTFNGTDIIGATNAVYLLADVQLTNAGTYSVTITNILGSTASSNALLTVLLTPPCDPAPSGITAWWPAEGNANDIISANNGTPIGNLSYANGEVGQAFVFDGSTSDISVPASASLNIGTGGGMTIECWINPSVTNANSPGGAGGPLIEWDSDDTDGCEFWVDADNSLYCNIKDTSGNPHTFQTTGGVVNSNIWQHVALTYDEGSGLMTMYVNGNVVGSSDFGSFSPQTTYPVNLGQRTGEIIGYGDTYAGMMDELSLYNRALSSNEIAAIYNAGSAGKCPPAPIPPVIVAQPTNETVAVGETTSFSVVASSTVALSYQWTFDGTNLTGATNATLTLTDVQLSQAGTYAVVVANVYGSTISSNATLTVYGVPPFITTQPTNEAVGLDGTASFSVVAGGTVTLSYQWSFDGTNLTGATNATLTLTDVQFSQAGTYAVAITNAYGSTNSAGAVLSVYGVPPFITTQPANQTVTAGGTASFNVVAGGTAPLSYLWSFDGITLPTETNATLTLTNMQPGEAGDYAVTVANPYGSTNSIPATLTVNFSGSCDPVPSGIVAWWPGDGNANDIIGTNNGTPIGNLTYTNGEVGQAFVFDGSTSYITVPASPSLNIGTGGGLTIECWINPSVTNASSPGGAGGPLIEWDSQDTDGSEFWADGDYSLYVNIKDTSGNSHTFQTAAGIVSTNTWQHVALTYDEGSGLMTMYVNGNVVGSANFGSFSPQTTYPVNLGRRTGQPIGYGDTYAGMMDELSLYNRALSSNEIAAIYNAGSAGKCTSTSAPPVIVTQPTNETVAVGQTASFSVVASSTSALSYQWTFDGTNLTGATNATLPLTDVQLSQAGTYAVVVANVYGSAVSSNATLTVYGVPPFITTQPANQTVTAGGTASFNVVAGGTAPLSYLWSFDGITLPTETNATLTLTNVQPGEAGDYAVTVANPYGSTNSIPATLTVNFSGSCDPVPSGIVAWWPGDGNANDIIGTNNGILEGSISFGPGEVGEAFLYTTTNDAVRIPASPSLNVAAGGSFTVEAWINPSDVSQSHCIFEWNNGSAYGAQFYVTVDPTPGSLYANIVDTGGEGHIINPSVSPLKTNVFQHVALTYDQASGTATIYCNGAIVGQQNLGSFTPQTSYDLYLGRRPLGFDSTYTFSGLIDEPSIYNRALSSNEIAAIYNAGSGGKCRPFSLPFITEQPTNVTVSAANNAVFTVAAGGSMPLSYQWMFNGSNSIPGATNSALVLTNVQFANEGSYSVTVTNLYGSAISSNALLIVTVDHFAWNTIPSPRFVNSPFQVEIVAQDAVNGVFTNYTGIVFIGSTNGVPVSPTVSSNFVNGVWTGTIAVLQTATNLALSAADGSGHAGFANPINIVNLPQLASVPSGGTLYISWPVNPAGFVLETSTNLATGNWSPVTMPPLQFGGLYVEPITLTGTNANAFYRLQFTGPY